MKSVELTQEAAGVVLGLTKSRAEQLRELIKDAKKELAVLDGFLQQVAIESNGTTKKRKSPVFTKPRKKVKARHKNASAWRRRVLIEVFPNCDVEWRTFGEVRKLATADKEAAFVDKLGTVSQLFGDLCYLTSIGVLETKADPKKKGAKLYRYTGKKIDEYGA